MAWWEGHLGESRVRRVSAERKACPALVGAPQVLTAQQLPKLNAEKPNSIVDPLVRVEIHGVPADCARKETNYVLNNGGWACWRRWRHTAESAGRRGALASWL